MKYLRARFTGYVGFYSGMGLEVLDIDFSKATHSIILIIGNNGCGKSTLINSLSIFPDPSAAFIPNKDAEKYIVLQDQNNIYEIRIISNADDKGGRKTTKAFISKNGTELNENGNVSSYKETIFTEFELDSNYESLSCLSSTNRGLADKTPAERKKFASNIIDNLETYNNIYKNLNKKSLIYKSHLNTLHSKIQNIGDRELLNSKLSSLKLQETDINNKLISANNNIVVLQTKNSIDESELSKIQSASSKLSEYDKAISTIQNSIDILANKTKISIDKLSAKYTEDSELMNQYITSRDNLSAIWKNLYNDLDNINSSLSVIKTDSIKFNADDDTLASRYKDQKSQLQNIERQLSVYPTQNPDDIYELEKLGLVYDSIISYIDSLYDDMDTDSMKYLVYTYSETNNANLSNSENDILAKINSNKSKIDEIIGKMKILSTLESRPSKCKIDSCPFIKEALDLKKTTKDIETQLFDLKSENDKLTGIYLNIEDEIALVKMLSSKKTKLDDLRRLVFENQSLISKYNAKFIENFDGRLASLNPFNDIRDHKDVSDNIIYLKLYKDKLEKTSLLEVEYKGFQEKMEILESNKKMEATLNVKKATVEEEIAETKSSIDKYQSLIDQLQSTISLETEYNNNLLEKARLINESKEYRDIMDNYAKKSRESVLAIEEIKEYQSIIEKLNIDLNPVKDAISTITGQLTLLDSYYAEYAEYKESYDIIETIKKYCSPTGGIQTLFMQLYMGKTLELSNSVLSQLFSGEYRLLDFIINESEFRIPFIGSGLPVDDISSGSTSQISIMGMVINLVLLHQASTKFNIAKLDEIDAGLDNKNRSDFINFIFYTMNLLQIEQIFMISHSIEVDNTNADIIKLKTYDDYESGIQSGNIIYDYNSEK